MWEEEIWGGVKESRPTACRDTSNVDLITCTCQYQSGTSPMTDVHDIMFNPLMPSSNATYLPIDA